MNTTLVRFGFHQTMRIDRPKAPTSNLARKLRLAIGSSLSSDENNATVNTPATPKTKTEGRWRGRRMRSGSINPKPTANAASATVMNETASTGWRLLIGTRHAPRMTKNSDV